ncbi:MAG: hypothetical protein ACTHKG_07375 [Nocardioides sp.]
MVTKKQRRAQLERARTQRRSDRLAAREARNRRVRMVLTLVVVAAAAAALVFWITTHDGGATAAARIGVY